MPLEPKTPLWPISATHTQVLSLSALSLPSPTHQAYGKRMHQLLQDLHQKLAALGQGTEGLLGIDKPISYRTKPQASIHRELLGVCSDPYTLAQQLTHVELVSRHRSRAGSSWKQAASLLQPAPPQNPRPGSKVAGISHRSSSWTKKMRAGGTLHPLQVSREIPQVPPAWEENVVGPREGGSSSCQLADSS